MQAAVTNPDVLNEGWRELCTRYLPIIKPDSIWRYSRLPSSNDRKQGWKLHISATVLSANEILKRVGPFLAGQDVQFKGPASLYEIAKLNSGLDYGYSQVGKCLTVYPRSDGEAVSIAEKLDVLTSGVAAPQIPFDLRLNPESCVHYRYGAFVHQQVATKDGKLTLAIETPDLSLIPDVRNSATAPAWATDPFRSRRPPRVESAAVTPLVTRFQILRAVSQRGKGGVYYALDRESSRLCIIKEGRKHGELGWDGRDGYSRVRNESEVLPFFRNLGLPVPIVYGTFEVGGSFYLAMEFIQGSSLQEVLRTRKRRLRVSQILDYAIQIAELLDTLHNEGWVWRDCKPSNLTLTESGFLRPFDFEGACPEGEENLFGWTTPVFTPPECKARTYRASGAQDLYALGVSCYYLLTGQYPDKSGSVRVADLRRNLPAEVIEVVESLLRNDPADRPTAAMILGDLQRLATAYGVKPILRARSANLGSDRRSSNIGSDVSEVIGGNRSA